MHEFAQREGEFSEDDEANSVEKFLLNLSKRVSVLPDDLPMKQEDMDAVEKMTCIGKDGNLRPSSKNAHRRQRSSMAELKALLNEWQRAQEALAE